MKTAKTAKGSAHIAKGSMKTAAKATARGKSKKTRVFEKSPQDTSPSYPALRLEQNAFTFYFTTIPIEDLFPVCFVARRREDPAQGFQRALNESRAEDIAKYLAEGTGSIPINIVLSAQAEANLTYASYTKQVKFDRIAGGSFLVLDGQHRLWGYQKCSVRLRVPVAIVDGLSRAQEARLFIDINTNQKGVPAQLLLDIKKLAERENEAEGILRLVFDRLATDPRSALNGRLSASETAAKKLSRVTFNRALGSILGGSVLSGMTQEDQYLLVMNYINAFDAELETKDILVRPSFFEAIFEIFDEVIRSTFTASSNAKQASIQQTIRPVATMEFSGLNKLTRKALVTAMQTALRRGVRISQDHL